MKCMEVKDFLCWLDVDFGSDCDAAVCKMNAVLRRHYTKLIGSQATKSSLWFVWSWEHTLQSPNGENIYKVHWVHVQLCDECDPDECHIKMDWCSCSNWYMIPLKPSLWDIDPWTYVTDCDKVSINVWCNVKKWYIIYSRWPKEIESLDETICFDPLEEDILQTGIMRHYFQLKKELEMANYYEQMEFNARKHLKEEVESQIPYKIGFGKINCRKCNGK